MLWGRGNVPATPGQLRALFDDPLCKKLIYQLWTAQALAKLDPQGMPEDPLSDLTARQLGMIDAVAEALDRAAPPREARREDAVDDEAEEGKPPLLAPVAPQEEAAQPAAELWEQLRPVASYPVEPPVALQAACEWSAERALFLGFAGRREVVAANVDGE